MSTKYTGGFITKSPVAPTSSAASGIWTLDQQQQAQKAGTWPSPPMFIEDLFSTYLYTGNGTSQTITNGIDLSGKGGLVWLKWREGGGNHQLQDTVRGATNLISSNTTDAQVTDAQALNAFTSSGFTVGSLGATNGSGRLFCSWTFREQAKFFDVVTYTGTGVGGQTVPHNLGSTPGMVIIKVTSEANDWIVWHRGLTSGYYVKLNTTAAQSNTNAIFFFGNGTTTVDPTSSVITLGGSGLVSGSGKSYVAYLFAHDAGGFPASGSGSTNGISCGSYAGTGSNVVVNLGYEPQWVMIKNITTSGGGYDWYMADNMRGIPMSGDTPMLQANLSDAESGASQGHALELNATGFTVTSPFGALNNSGNTYIYIAIRRGPMKTPTVGTTAFSPIAYTGNSTSNTTVQNLTTNISGDATLIVARNNPQNPFFADKLRGNVFALYTSLTSAQENFSTARPGQSIGFNNTQTVLTGQFTAQGTYNYSGDTIVSYNFQRAPSVFDEVILSSSTTTYTHNLTVTPELILVKCTNAAGANWVVYSKSLSSPTTQYLNFNGVNAVQTHGAGAWAVSSTQFSVDPGLWANGSVGVSYLFATCAGVSKVGSYTGTGALLTLDCGFTTGARFVLIKRTDSTGDWYVWDSARGITSGNDPYSRTNTASLETTGTNYVDTDTTGFQVTAAAPAALNASGGTYIFLAIA